MAKELKLMKGNEAIAQAMIASGCDGYFGYPITTHRSRKEWRCIQAFAWKKK